MPELPTTVWLVEQGIGEDRAILIQHGEVRAARLRRHGGLHAGLVTDARLIARHSGSRRGTVLFDDGDEALVDALPKEAREGAMLRVEVLREALAEKGRFKRAQTRPTNSGPRPAPSLVQVLRASGIPVKVVQRFPQDPWSDLIGEAADGTIGFAGGSLTISPTPAMTLIDIDGTLPSAQLALAAVPPIAEALGRLDLAGSIGIDFPTLDSRDDRRRLDEALAAALDGWPHQRTAMNGFGFVQIVSRLERPSILGSVQSDPVLAGALLLLRRAEDVTRPGTLLLTAHPRVLARIAPEWQDELARRTGRAIHLTGDPALAPLSAFAQAVPS